MEQGIPQFVIAAPTSGSGKTTLSRGLMALLTQRGLKVQPYKCGPDYIDTKYHEKVCGCPSVNLDSFMASEQHIHNLYACHAKDADACVIEGMMGLFDGYNRSQGSSADIAALLQLPVVLVVDAKSAAYSMAALLSGFLHFDPRVCIAGVIFNRVGSPRHYEMLLQVCQDLHVTCFGYLPKELSLEQTSRYLGLDFSQADSTESLHRLISLLEQHVDIELLLQCTTQPRPQVSSMARLASSHLHITVARNREAFSFLYAEHIDLLKGLGEVTFFDPEANQPLPNDTDLLYLPGGYPEKHAKALSEATETLASIRRYAEQGGRILAECGGLIYLSQGIYEDNADGQSDFTPLAQVFPFAISNRKADRKLSLGYRQFHYNGQELKGHEFHYTQFAPETASVIPASIIEVQDAKGRTLNTPVFRYKNIIAGYTHLYWGEINLLKLFE